ncbi:MAG: hypothetical protein HY820_22090 [Acidobacteria bacterium]|nr:hypothetical protein [Acidobacteriota bacterium]
MLVTLSALLVFVLIQPAFAVLIGEGRVTARGLDQYGLSLIPSSSPEFPRLMQRAAGRTRFHELDELLPYSVLLVNASKKRLVFYSVRWSSTSDKGVTVHDDRMYYNLATLRGGYALDPGGVTLVTVVDAVGRPLKGEDQKSFSQRFYQSRMDLQFLHQAQITISLDVAIFASGEVVGPDASRSVSQAQDRLDSANDLYTAFEDRASRNEPVQNYVGWLRDLASEPRTIASLRPNRWYRYHIQNLAQELIRIHEHGGENALRDRLRQAYRPNIRLHR